jgi:hypothetical protein
MTGTLPAKRLAAGLGIAGALTALSLWGNDAYSGPPARSKALLHAPAMTANASQPARAGAVGVAESPAAPGLVTAELVGGLGNQLFIIATALAYSLHTGRQPAFHAQEQVASVTPRHGYWSSLLRDAPRQWLRAGAVDFHVNHAAGPDGAPIPSYQGAGTVQISGYCQHEAYFRSSALDAVRLLGLDRRRSEGRVQLAAEVAALLRAAGDDAPSEPLIVAVHVRRGDYVALSHLYALLGPTYYGCGADKLHAALAGQLGVGGNSNTTGQSADGGAGSGGAGGQEAATPRRLVFAVFSDEADGHADLESVKALLRLHGAVVRVQPRGADRDYEEWQLMAGADAFLLANSTFSWWAAYVARVLAQAAGESLPPVVMPDVDHGTAPGRTVAGWMVCSDRPAGTTGMQLALALADPWS